MATNAFISGITLEVGDSASPENFAPLEEMRELSGVGSQRELINVTHFASNNIAEFIAGIQEGAEMTISCNKNLTATVQQSLITDARNPVSVTRNIQVKVTDGTTTKTLAFAAVISGEELGPNVESENRQNYTMKITSAITET